MSYLTTPVEDDRASVAANAIDANFGLINTSSDIIWAVKIPDNTPAANVDFVSQYVNAVNQKRFIFRLQTDGSFRPFQCYDGTNLDSVTFAADAISSDPEEVQWFRLEHSFMGKSGDANVDFAGDHKLRLFRSYDEGVTWVKQETKAISGGALVRLDANGGLWDPTSEGIEIHVGDSPSSGASTIGWEWHYFAMRGAAKTFSPDPANPDYQVGNADGDFTLEMDFRNRKSSLTSFTDGSSAARTVTLDNTAAFVGPYTMTLDLSSGHTYKGRIEQGPKRYNLWRYMNWRDVGYNVLITGGVATATPGSIAPDADAIAAADSGSGEGGKAWFRGGKTYTVNGTEELVLASAGYTIS